MSGSMMVHLSSHLYSRIFLSPCSGYGLPIARNYARHFGGDIQIHNRPGQGCDVVVTLSQLGDTKEKFL